jgi:hypothetical protein
MSRLLWALWKSPLARAAGIMLIVAGGIWYFGASRYRAGHRDGVALEYARAVTQETIAKAIADSTWQVLFRQSVAIRDSLAVARAAAERAERAANKANAALSVAQARYADARALDTTSSPALQRCDELATSCAAAQQAAEVERDAKNRELNDSRAALRNAEAQAALEPERQRAASNRAIREWRMANPGPPRLPAFLLGVGVGAGVAFTLQQVVP